MSSNMLSLPHVLVLLIGWLNAQLQGNRAPEASTVPCTLLSSLPPLSLFLSWDPHPEGLSHSLPSTRPPNPSEHPTVWEPRAVHATCRSAGARKDSRGQTDLGYQLGGLGKVTQLSVAQSLHLQSGSSNGCFLMTLL